jgi:ubiquinone/menaquinone biosynthesis C-methylase UbiE
MAELNHHLNDHVQSVRDFYNKHTVDFLQVYGEIIQAFRTQKVEDYLSYTCHSLGMKDGEIWLDAGCGVAGPASYFARQFPNIQIEAISISEDQINRAAERLASTAESRQIHLQQMDYHQLSFADHHFDGVYFLESFGHSDRQVHLIQEATRVLKPGGKLYIKDLFRRLHKNEWAQLRIDQLIHEINQAYAYHVCSLTEILDALRMEGMHIQFIKEPVVDPSTFEQLSISNAFQEATGIGKISSWDHYIFPIEFFEILAIKPVALEAEKFHLYSKNQAFENG